MRNATLKLILLATVILGASAAFADGPAPDPKPIPIPPSQGQVLFF
jgi:hypothetical protein